MRIRFTRRCETHAKSALGTQMAWLLETECLDVSLQKRCRNDVLDFRSLTDAKQQQIHNPSLLVAFFHALHVLHSIYFA
jgi:hypothetical protein